MGKRQKEMEKKCRIQVLGMIKGAGLIILLFCILVFVVAWMMWCGVIAEDNGAWIMPVICFTSALLVSAVQRTRHGGCAAEGGLSALAAGCCLTGFGKILWGEISVEKGVWNILLFVLGGSLFGIFTGNKKKRRRN